MEAGQSASKSIQSPEKSPRPKFETFSDKPKVEPAKDTSMLSGSKTVTRDTPKLAAAKSDMKPTPPVESARFSKMKQEVITQLEKKKLKKDLGPEYGDEDEEEHEVVPAIVAKFPFMLLSQAIDCPKAELDEKEATALSEALSEVLPKLDSKVWALFLIVAITVMKLLECKQAVQHKLMSLRTGYKGSHSTGKPKYDDKKQAMVTR